jgi:hypothetical protein
MTTGLVTLFLALIVATAALAFYRLTVVRFKGDNCLHLLEADAPVVARQQLAARKLETIDVWGKMLTILTATAGIGAYVSWWLDV